MSRPGTWKPEQLTEMRKTILNSKITIKQYCEENKIAYHKLYQAFRRNNLVGEYSTITPTIEIKKELAAV